jgi:hypothetical protein
MSKFLGNENGRDLILERLETRYGPDDVVIYPFAGLDITLRVEWILKTYRALSAERRSSMNESIRLGEENDPDGFTDAD